MGTTVQGPGRESVDAAAPIRLSMDRNVECPCNFCRHVSEPDPLDDFDATAPSGSTDHQTRALRDFLMDVSLVYLRC